MCFKRRRSRGGSPASAVEAITVKTEPLNKTDCNDKGITQDIEADSEHDELMLGAEQLEKLLPD